MDKDFKESDLRELNFKLAKIVITEVMVFRKASERIKNKRLKEREEKEINYQKVSVADLILALKMKPKFRNRLRLLLRILDEVEEEGSLLQEKKTTNETKT